MSRSKAAARLIARTGRLALLARDPSRKELLVVRNAAYNPGLFAAFATVLGLLEHYDNWRDLYAGIKVDFGARGLYYDPSAGENWWDYYFEPFDAAPAGHARMHVISDDEQIRFAKRVERSMPRQRGYRLIQQYIRPRPQVREKVDAYVRAHFEGDFVIGVHYRGTDKLEDAPRVPYESVRAAILDAIGAAGPRPFRLFVATDEQAFVDFMRERFPDGLHCLEMQRSVDGSPIDVLQGDNVKKGEAALLDCLLLSRCDRLVRTASNLSLCSALFNPDMPVVVLNRER